MATNGANPLPNDTGYVKTHIETSVESAEAKCEKAGRHNQFPNFDPEEDLIDLGHDDQNNSPSLPLPQSSKYQLDDSAPTHSFVIQEGKEPRIGFTARSKASAANAPLSDHYTNDINEVPQDMPGSGRIQKNVEEPSRSREVTPSKEPDHSLMNTQIKADTSRASPSKEFRKQAPVPVAEEIDVPRQSSPSNRMHVEGEVSNDSHSTVLDPIASTVSGDGQREVIRIPRAQKVPTARKYPPGITFLDVPREAKIQDILSLIRKTSGCRIRLVNLKHKEKTGKLFFVDWAAHDIFLNDARGGHIQAPWDADMNISVDETDVFNPTIDGELLEDATRILRIRNLPERVTLDTVLEDLVRSGAGWMFCIEKAILFKMGQNYDELTAQLNFTSIRGAVRARECLEEDPDNVTKYEFTETSFAADECSSEYDPPPTISMVDWRGYTKGSRLPMYLITNGYIRLPRVGPKPEPLPPMLPRPTSPSSRPTSAGTAGPAKAQRPPPPTYPPHGIHIKGLPSDITYSTLLSVVRGGKVLQANIFNPKPKNDGGVRGAAVFFVEKEDADRILAYLTNKGGLWVPNAEDGPGKRYVVTRYVNNLTWQQPSMAPFASRSVSLSFEDTPTNKKITTAKVWNTIKHDIPMFMENETMWESTYTKLSPNAPPIQKRRLVFSLISIAMATAAFQLLKHMGNVEGRHVARYEEDPCVGSVDEMS
ncbi:MAG: hypothetical protein M1836_000388 [Candelina mexicana]|nr:MAG: hypothetical protein M1836_000388 [Candelina mexicana]